MQIIFASKVFLMSFFFLVFLRYLFFSHWQIAIIVLCNLSISFNMALKNAAKFEFNKNRIF